MSEQIPSNPLPQNSDMAAAQAIAKLLNATPQTWALRACLGVLFISVFLPWYSIEMFGESHSFAIIHDGMGVFILILTLASLALLIMVDLQVLKTLMQRLMAPAAIVVTALITLITVFSEKPPFCSITWGAWLGLLAAIGAAGLAVMQNLAAIQGLVAATKAQQQNSPPPPQNPPAT